MLPQFLRDLLASPPSAGEGVHNWLFRVARHLHAHYPDKAEMVRLLEAATEDVGRPVSGQEIEDAIRNSESAAWRPTPSGNRPKTANTKWPAVDLAMIEKLARNRVGLVDLWEASPVPIVSGESQTEAVIDRLFPRDALLCCGRSNSVFDTKPREDWRGELSDLPLIVPSPMSALTGLTKEGRKSKHSLNNTGPRRFLVVECDFSIYARDGKTETKYAPLIRSLNKDGIQVADMCAAVLLHLAQYAPLVCVVHSGGKSLHGWYFVDAQPAERVQKFFRYAVSVGADPATWTPLQFVRVPDGTRENGKPQSIFFLNFRPLEGAC